MDHALPSDIQQRIAAQLASGTFASEEDVIREALEALERRQHGLSHLRELVAVAENDVAAGRIGTFDRAATKLAVRDQLAERGKAD